MKSNIDEVSLDITKIAHSLRRSTETLKPLSRNCCIYRVPPHLRDLNNGLYTPQVVSIGPFHHGTKELKVMEEHKRRYLCAFLNRIKIGVEEYIERLKVLELRLRRSYVDMDGYDREEFMEIMAVDGAFLIEYLLKHYFRLFKSNDRVLQLRINVILDLFLIENQLPFFYLEYLFELFKESVGDHGALSLTKIVQNFLSMATPWLWPVTVIDNNIVTEEGEVERQVHHLLHFFLVIFLQQPQTKQRMGCTSLATPTISELHQAGVKFKPSSSNGLSNINFSNGILEIPKLQVSDDSEMLFRNMQAFEVCHGSVNYISDYISIMDILINNEQDVKILVRNGIIENCLEDDRAAATLFNNLGKGTAMDTDEFRYSHVIEDLNSYYKVRRHRWKATLKQKYFNNPWTIVSVVAAAFLLLLTLIQTVCSILQVV